MLPEAFLERMQNLMDEAEYEAFLASFEKPKFQGLRLNAGKYNLSGETADSMARACEQAIGNTALEPVPWAENGYYYAEGARPGKHPYHEAGVYYIQEPSAMAPVSLLAPKPGDRILDLCAAPGGKSTQIAAAMQGEGILVSNEIHPARAKILSENMERMGVPCAVVTNETPERLAQHFTGFFDKILVDAPCSGEGMFRKNEDATGEWSPENVDLCGERQDGILDCAVQMLRPGGILVYSTCTFAEVEDEGSICRLLQRCPQMRILPADSLKAKMPGPAGSADGRPEWGKRYEGTSSSAGTGSSAGTISADVETGEKTGEKTGVKAEPKAVPKTEPQANLNSDAFSLQDLAQTVRLWPQYIDGEGHFAAILQKKGEGEQASGAMPLGGYEPSLSGKTLAGYADFLAQLLPEDALLREELKADYPGQGGKGASMRQMDGSRYGFLQFGENLYRMPAGTPNLKGLKIMRPGLQLGSMKKDRFEPSHALALYLNPVICAKTQHLINLNVDQAKQYLAGMTINADPDALPAKGWCQVCVDGFSIGWGKMAGGIVKNHYPKGLRK